MTDPHSLNPYIGTYGDNMSSGSASHPNAPLPIDTSHQQFDNCCNAPLSTLHPGMLGPQSPSSYYSYPPTGPYLYSGQQAQSYGPERHPSEQQPTPNNVDYTWQALMASIGVQGRPA
jgi:hypothetical protein